MKSVLARAYTIGYKQGRNKVNTKMSKKLAVDVNEFDLIDDDAMNKVKMWSNTLALKESTEIINKVNVQIALGISGGESISKISNRIEDVFVKYGGSSGRFLSEGKRAELIARAETQRVVNMARLDSYADAGIKQYEWLAWLDDRTDSECIALNGRVFSVDDIFAPHPVTDTHPNCRCVVIPVI